MGHKHSFCDSTVLTNPTHANSLVMKSCTYCEKLLTVPVQRMTACLPKPQLQMIKDTMKYINLILVYIKSTSEEPEKKVTGKQPPE